MIEYIEITIINQSNGFMKITVDHPSLEKPIVTTSDEVSRVRFKIPMEFYKILLNAQLPLEDVIISDFN